MRSGAISQASIQDSELPQVQALMLRYCDRPMDFADATLVYLAKREGISTVFTVDLADFETYRIDGRRRFRVFPPQTSRAAKYRFANPPIHISKLPFTSPQKHGTHGRHFESATLL